ncbi:ABC transporter family substrate-binding protein [Stackebrandtia soli]|uniref:ABC transporter family substrate-binding protein n=1 Tax=Stackebrandtia soli TaxID=1892856 RepID=UPI0039EAF50A
MTKTRRLSLVAAAAALFVTAACTSEAPKNDAKNSAEIQDVAPGGEITIAATSPITDWNPISANGDTTGQRQQQWPLYPHPFLTNPDTTVVVNEALLEKAEVVEADPMTVEYVLQDGVQWSDGTPISVDDFVYTQAVQDPSKCSECLAAFTEGYSDISSIEASDDGKTITMVYAEPFSEWRALFNYILPAHIADGYGDLATSFNEGFSKNVPEFSGGPYIIKDYTDGISMTMVPNPKWYGEGPNLETVTTRYITGQGEQLTALQNGEVQLVYSTPTVDTMDQAKQLQNMTIQTGSTLTYYHLGMKTTGDVMSDDALRTAIATALDLGDMRDRTIGQFASDVPQMKSSVYVPGQKIAGEEAYQDNMSDLGIGGGDVDGAIKILEEAGYKITNEQLIQPDGTPLRDLSFLTLGTDVLRMELAQIAQQQLLPLGITITIDAADGARYSPALREGDFDIMATGTALDLGPLSMQQWYGTDAPRSFGYSNEDADRLFKAAGEELEPKAQIELMNELDRVLLGDGVVLPLFGTPMMAVYPNTYGNIFINPSKYGTTMNIEQWGLLVEPGA